MPVNEDYYRDKRARTGRTGKAMRDRAQSRVDSGEVAFDWNTAPQSVRRGLENRLRVFEGQVPDDPLDQMRFIEAEQAERTTKAEAMAQPGPTKARAEMTDSHGPHPRSTEKKPSGDDSGSQGLTPDQRSLFVGGDPERGMSNKAVAERAMEGRMAMDEPDEEPMIRVGDLNGFYGSGIRLPENAPQWLREGFERMQESADFMQRRMPLQAVGGLVEGFQNTAHSLDLASLALKRSISGLNEMEQAYYDTINSPEYDPVARSPLGVVVERPDSIGGALARTFGQFLPLFMGSIGAMKAIGLSGGGMAGAVFRDITAGAMADFAVFNAMEGNLHTMMRELGEVDIPGVGKVNLDNMWTEWMDATEADTHTEGKLRNLIEGALFASGIELVYRFGQLIVRGGKMSREQAKNLADAIVRTSRATREMREMKYRAMEEDAWAELEKSSRENAGTLHANPVPNPQDVKNLTRIAMARIGRGVTTMEKFVQEWGQKHGYGVDVATKVYEEAEHILNTRGYAEPTYSRLVENVMRMPQRQPAELYMNSILSHQDIKADEFRNTRAFTWLEEQVAMGHTINRAQLVEKLGEMPIEMEVHVLGRHEGKTAQDNIVDKDSMGYRKAVDSEGKVPEGVSPEALRDEQIEAEIKLRQKELESGDREPLTIQFARSEFAREFRNQRSPADYEVTSQRGIEDFRNLLREGYYAEWMDREIVDEAWSDLNAFDRFSSVNPADPAIREDRLMFAAEELAFYYQGKVTAKASETFQNEKLKPYIDEELKNLREHLENDLSSEQFGIYIHEGHSDPDKVIVEVRMRAHPDAGGQLYLVDKKSWERAFDTFQREGGGIEQLEELQGGLFMVSPIANSKYEMVEIAYKNYLRQHPEAAEGIPTRSGKWGEYVVDPRLNTYEELVNVYRGNPLKEAIEARKDMIEIEQSRAERGEIDLDKLRAEGDGETPAERLYREATEVYGDEKGRPPYRGHSGQVHYGDIVGEDNLMHTRLSVEQAPFGKIVNIEEIQSDWAAQDLIRYGGKFLHVGKAQELMAEAERYSQAYKDFESKFLDGIRQMTDDIVANTSDVSATFSELGSKEKMGEVAGAFGADLEVPGSGYDDAIAHLFVDQPGAMTTSEAYQQARAYVDEHAMGSALRQMMYPFWDAHQRGGIVDVGERLTNAVRSYAKSLAKKVVHDGEMPLPPDDLLRRIKEEPMRQWGGDDPKLNEALEWFENAMQATYAGVRQMLDNNPEVLTYKSKANRLYKEARKYETGVPRPPLAEDNLWQEHAVRQAVQRAINIHNADRITMVPGQWQSYLWGNNPIAYRFEQDVDKPKLILFNTDRVSPSPHREADDSLDRVSEFADHYMGGMIDENDIQPLGTSRRYDLPMKDDSAARHTIPVGIAEFDLSMDREKLVQHISDRFSGSVMGSVPNQAERWAERILKDFDEGKPGGQFDPYRAGRSENYDRKQRKMLEKYVKNLAADADKKGVKAYVGKRKWADLESVSPVLDGDGNPTGKWSVRISPYTSPGSGRHPSNRYVIEAGSQNEALEIAEETITHMPIWVVDIPESAKKAARGGMPFTEFGGAAVGGAAVMGGREDATAD